MQQSQLAKPYKESFYQCISMVAKTSDSVVPENGNNVLVLEEKSLSQFKLEQLHSQERQQEGEKNVLYLLRSPTKQLIRFRTSLDGS